MAVGVVRAWYDEEGWGVIDSDETPGGCWAGFSSIDMDGLRRGLPGQRVTFTHRRVAQDGFDYVALDVEIEGVARAEPEVEQSGPISFSRLTIDWD